MLLGGLDDDARGHQSVSEAAHLRALNVVVAWAGCAKPAGDCPAWNGVLLQPEHWHRKAVEHVARQQLEMIRRVRFHVQLAHGANVIRGIEDSVCAGLLKAPGPLLAEN